MDANLLTLAAALLGLGVLAYGSTRKERERVQ